MALVVSASVSSAQTSAPKYILKLGAVTPPGTSQARVEQRIADRIDEATQGEVKAVWYFGAILGDDIEMVRKARLGQLDGGGWVESGLSEIAREVMLLGTPFFFNFTLNDYSEALCTLDGSLPSYQRLFERKGFVLVDWFPLGGLFFMSKQPFQSLKDVENLKFWSWSGYPMFQPIFDALGVKNQVSLSLTEVLPALQTGMIDATVAIPFGFVSLQWYTEQRYILDFPISFLNAAVVLKKSSLEKIPPPLQEKVLQAIRETRKEWLEVDMEGNGKIFQALLDYGIQPIRNPELMEQVKKRTEGVAKGMTGKYWSQEFYDQMVGLRDQCRALRSGPEAVE
ncbi:MAG: TRAP transporter substrate-binding protein DctP [Deltaproteobacteria bacterium]|nr:TRAP transporter substrate-binding protein DctP [Deltaproteobacteria bacterium]